MRELSFIGYVIIAPFVIAFLPFLTVVEHLKLAKKDDMGDMAFKIGAGLLAQAIVIGVLI